MTHEFISREIGDWSRFGNRRQVASYAGLCPSEYSSGGKRRQGPINKHGNPRLRKLLVETVWRFVQFQPKWIRMEKVAGNSASKEALVEKGSLSLSHGSLSLTFGGSTRARPHPSDLAWSWRNPSNAAAVDE